jgi:hypothetical protein
MQMLRMTHGPPHAGTDSLYSHNTALLLGAAIDVAGPAATSVAAVGDSATTSNT